MRMHLKPQARHSVSQSVTKMDFYKFNNPECGHVSCKPQVYLNYISTISPPYLNHISTISQPYFSHISAISQQYLSHISAISQPYLNHILAVSQPYLNCISAISQPYVNHTGCPETVFDYFNAMNRTLQTGGSLICKEIAKKYQPCGARGNASPPAKCKMAPRGPQNGRRGLERCLPIDQRLLNMFFYSSSSSMRKSCNEKKKWKKIMENKMLTTL